MIPILFSADATSFNNNGLGALADCTSCKVTEKRNGEYILTMQYPLDGIHFKDIQKSCIIWVKPSDGANNQAFRIYKTKKPINGIVTIEAEHISYQLSMIPTMPFTAESASAALQGLKTNAAEPCPFFFYTDKQTIATYTQEQPASIRSRLGGVSGSILDVYGGEYEFDNYDVHLWANRGSDKGVTIRYGKNLIDLKQEENIQNVVTGVVPFFANEETLVTLPEKVVESEYVDLYPYPRTVILDLSSEWTDEVPTVEQLRQRAQKYIEDNDIGIPKVSIDVSFIALWQTEEYKDIAPLERVNLCDTVTIKFEKLGIEAKAKVISTEYDVLRERYTKIEVGDAKSTLATTIVNIDSTTNTKIQTATSFLQKAIVHATDMITGGLGGYVYLKPNADGYPEEILIMDSPDIETAVNIWRWNKNGLGFSSTGYTGQYGTAITSDGKIVADYITAGTLNGDLIQAGTVNANALSAEAMEDLQLTHDYLPSNKFSNRSLWNTRFGDKVYFETIEGKTYLVLDGTELSSFSDIAWARIATNAVGNINFNVYVKYHVDRSVAISTQRFYHVTYYNSAQESGWINWWNLSAQTLDTDRDYTWNQNINISNIDSSMESTMFGLYFIPGAKLYLEELEITSLSGTYVSAGMTFTSAGLKIVTQEIEGYGEHSYIPYDAMANVDRWKIVKALETDNPTVSHETITVDGTSYDAIVIDGSNVSPNYESGTYAYLETDIIGSPSINCKYHYQANIDIAPATFTIIGYANGESSSGQVEQIFYNFVDAPNVIVAGTDYTYDQTSTPSLSIDYYRKKARMCFMFHSGAKLYIYGLSMTSPGNSYKKASLSYTADGLDSVVQNGSVISSINQSAEAVTIEARKLNLTGDLTLKGQFTAIDPTDTSNYVDMLHGEIAVINQGETIFTIDANPLIGSKAGIFFGNPEDTSELYSHTHLDNEQVSTPGLMGYSTGDHQSDLSDVDTSLVSEGTARFYGGISVSSDPTQTSGVTIINSFRNATQFFGNVYNSSGGTQFVSDRRKKRNIVDLAVKRARSFIMALKPVKYKFTKDISTSDRYHHGFIAQDVKKAMPEDWGLYCVNKENDFIGLRYDEFIADMIAVIQDHERRIQNLEDELKRSKK